MAEYAKVIIILLNSGEKIVMKEPKNGDYEWWCDEWAKAHKADAFIHPIDIEGFKHKVNARRVISIFEGKMQSAEDTEEKEELDLDQT